jgi:hypothetical protein
VSLVLPRPTPELSVDPFFISTGAIAVGELGDKTQLLSLILATRLGKPIPISPLPAWPSAARCTLY